MEYLEMHSTQDSSQRENILQKKITDLEDSISILENQYSDLLEQYNQQKQYNQIIESKLSLHPYSGLPTHHMLSQELVSLIEKANLDPQKNRFSLIILQLDRSFETIRKTLKSNVSEWVLYQLGSRFNEILSAKDRIFHTHDHEFIIISYWDEKPQLQNSLHKYLQCVRSPHIFSGFHVTLDCVMGIAHFPDHGTEKGSLLHKADLALGNAIEHKKHFLVYHDEMHEKIMERLDLQNSIIKAIEAPAMGALDRQFEIFFQPKITVKKIEGNKVYVQSIDAESLIRWKHPEHGFISPSKFIPIAEETGLIMVIGKWYLYSITEIINAWKQPWMSNIGISVNISPRQLKSGELLDIFSSIFNQMTLPKGRITLEVTETSIMDDLYDTIDKIEKIKALGLGLSIDDFGTGYSSLSHLHRIPLDEIKIDQSFIKFFPENRQDKAIINSLVAIAKELDLKLVAEGVERMEQLEELLRIGCSCIQGFLFSKPLPQKEFIDFVWKIHENGMIIDLPRQLF
jgi:EAL domain-containing protein (putative c-di-GMP-specific phosphodiesterase class I)/GGDEF domain-containing protein